MSSVSSTELATAQGSLNAGLRELWTTIEGHDADRHSVAFGRTVHFDAGALSTLLVARQVAIDPALRAAYCDDMRVVRMWSGGRAQHSTDADRHGWVRLVGQRRPEYANSTDASRSADPVLDFIIKGSDLDALGYDVYAAPALPTPHGWSDDEYLRVIDTEEIAKGAMQPATLEETLALDAIVQSIQNIVKTPVS